MKLEEIDKSTLKVGDTVGVMCSTIINWCYEGQKERIV